MSGNLNCIRIALISILCLVVGTLSAQTVNGTVVDGEGTPIIGATIIEDGQPTNGAVTDIDGNFSIRLKGGKNTLVVSYVGMKAERVALEGRSYVKVTMAEDEHSLNDVVVIGYGTVRKKDLTGSVSSVSAKDIASVPVSNVSEALTGKLPGVSITTTEGAPDAEVKIRVRGGGSLSQDNSPLYIVDGFPVASISDIAPSEIETIDVLKDASSTAIYGARGANGVIIITTKSGSEGKILVNLNASIGWKKVTKKLKTLDPYNYALYQYELDTDDNHSYGNYDDLASYKNVAGNDFQDAIFGRTGVQKQYNANVSGGSKDFKFNVGISHNDEKSIMLGSGYNKNNINTKINANINKWLSVDFTGRIASSKVDGLAGGADKNESSAANSIVANSLRWRPIEPVVSEGDDEESNTSAQRNPLDRLLATYRKKDRLNQAYNGGLNWKPFRNVTFRTEFGYTWDREYDDHAWAADAVTTSKYGYNGKPQSRFETDKLESWRNANTFTYDNDHILDGRDHINVMVGQEWSSQKEKTIYNTSVNYPATFTTSDVLAYNLIGTPLPNENYIYANDNLLSYFGRINYTIADKYLATVTFRADGSSKFGSGHRWGYFPSVALAWRLNEEEWLKNVNGLTNLKLRLSYGTAGNNRIQSGLLNLSYLLSGNAGKHPGFDEENATMLQHGERLNNPNLKWETTTTRNVGIDYGFWNNRINGSLDLYWNTTSDLLMDVNIPTGSGYTKQMQNFGETSNKGIEFSMNTAIIQNKDFNLNFDWNVAWNTNRIEKLKTNNVYMSSNFAGSFVSRYEDYLITEGGKLGEIWGYKTNGFFTVYNPATGTGDLVLDGTTWKLRDGLKDNSYSYTGGSLYPGTLKLEVDENGTPVKQRLGNSIPDVVGGFGLNGNLGNFDFNFYFTYSLGNQIINGTKLVNSYYQGSQKNYNLVDEFNINNRYTWIDPANGMNIGRPTNDIIAAYGSADALMQRLNELNANASIWNPAASAGMPITDWAVEDASFLRMQNLTIGYSLPKSLLKSVYITNLRLYFTAYNLFTVTGYSGYDPEVDTSSKNNPMTPGIDYAAYPKSRSFVAGVNVTF